MKIIHTSDIHLDSPLTSRLSPEKVRERRRELLSGFGRLIKEGESIGAGAMIIAGDLFDGTRVSVRAMDTALAMIGESPNMQFYYLAGNHEGDAIMQSGKKIPENLHVFGSGWSHFSIDGVDIYGRSEIKEGMFSELALKSEGKNIVVLHGELRDKTAAPEAIGLSEARGRGIDYLALGHYHSYSATAIDDRGVAVYCGTPEGRGFDETGEKGYVLIDTDKKRIEYSFCPFASRRLISLPLDISGISRSAEIAERASRLVAPIRSRDIVRLELCGRYHPSLWKDTEGLLRLFSDRFYYFEVKDISKIAINPEEYKLDRSLKGEFIRCVSSDEGLSEEEKERIIACGINALMGEELFE